MEFVRPDCFTGNFLNKRHKKLSYFTHEIFKRDYLIQADGKYKGYPLRTQAGGEMDERI